MNTEISCWVCPHCEWDTHCCVVEDVKDCLFVKEKDKSRSESKKDEN